MGEVYRKGFSWDSEPLVTFFPFSHVKMEEFNKKEKILSKITGHFDVKQNFTIAIQTIFLSKPIQFKVRLYNLMESHKKQSWTLQKYIIQPIYIKHRNPLNPSWYQWKPTFFFSWNIQNHWWQDLTGMFKCSWSNQCLNGRDELFLLLLLISRVCSWERKSCKSPWQCWKTFLILIKSD